jgi:glycosyltransferase involved in cell wall biosynthesis
MSNKTALFIGYIWPEPKTTAAGHRMLQLLQGFKENDFKVVFASTAQQTQYSLNLSTLEIEAVPIKLNHSSFDVFIAELKPDIVVFDRFMIEEQFGWRVAEFAPKALRILNTEDLHSLRNTRRLCYKSHVPFTAEKWKDNDSTKREIAAIYRSDLTLLISSVETALLEDVFRVPKTILFTIPFMLEASGDKFPSFEARKDFVFIGNGKHAPNIDAIKYLKSAIWPAIRKELPEANLNIYGAYLPQQVNEMHNPSNGFLVHGWLKDLEETLGKTCVNLAPLRFGAGLKGKVIDGMRNGTPTVTTTIGAEGIPNLHAYDDTISFTKCALELYSNKWTWLKSQQLQQQIIAAHFLKEQLAPLFFERIDDISHDLLQHRSNNFIGALLQHQTMASTKFMSKWIEEKNKKS